jgi:hypothetical protein
MIELGKEVRLIDGAIKFYRFFVQGEVVAYSQDYLEALIETEHGRVWALVDELESVPQATNSMWLELSSYPYNSAKYG